MSEILSAIALLILLGGLVYGAYRGVKNIRNGKWGLILAAAAAPTALAAQSVSIGVGWSHYDVLGAQRGTERVVPQLSRGHHHGHGHRHEHDDDIVYRTVYEYQSRGQSSGVVVEAVGSWTLERWTPNLVVSWEAGRDRPAVLPQLSVRVSGNERAAVYGEVGMTDSEWADWEPHGGLTIAASMTPDLSAVATLRTEPWQDWRPTSTIKANWRVW